MALSKERAVASKLPKSESIEFKQGQRTRMVNIYFTENECKIAGKAARQAQLYSCFTIVHPGGKVSTITYLLNSTDAKPKENIS